MADMGLAGSFGAGGAGDAIATVMAQRRQAALDQQNQENFQQQMAQTDALTRLKAQEQADAVRQRVETTRQAELDRVEAAKAHRTQLIDAQLKEIPTDTPLSQPTVAGMTSEGILPERFSPQPASEPAPPPGIAAPGAPTTPQPMPGTVANAPAPNQVSFTRIPTAQEMATQQAATQKTQDAQTLEAQRASERADNARLIASLKTTPDKLTKVEHKDPATGRTVIEWLPQSQLAGQKFEKGAGLTVENRLDSAQAVQQTGQDIIAKLSDPAYSKNLGVAMGRVSSLRDFIGNPPPEFSELAGNIESYALASMGVHGMRSASGAEKIKELLDAHHTPESLIATIKGLNAFSSHFMENEGRTATGASNAAVKRYNPATGKVE